jgi:hypothetical protein
MYRFVISVELSLYSIYVNNNTHLFISLECRYVWEIISSEKSGLSFSRVINLRARVYVRVVIVVFVEH